MHRLLISCFAVAVIVVPMAAGAQNLQPLLYPAAQNTVPPKNSPGAFTAAPVPGFLLGGYGSSVRAGGAEDAGPMNATPLSGELSSVLTGGPTARALSLSRGDQDPSSASQFSD